MLRKNYVYEGTFVNGVISGYGRFIWPTYEVRDFYYEGEFKNGLFHGEGKLFINGKVKDGKFFFGSYVSDNLIDRETR